MSAQVTLPVSFDVVENLYIEISNVMRPLRKVGIMIFNFCTIVQKYP
jgi:hypothetical protein